MGVGAVEGFSGAVQARSAKICLMHSLNLGPAQASLKVTGEACTERSRRKKSCSSRPHATSFSLDSALVAIAAFILEKCRILSFQLMQKTCYI